MGMKMEKWENGNGISRRDATRRLNPEKCGKCEFSLMVKAARGRGSGELVLQMSPPAIADNSVLLKFQQVVQFFSIDWSVLTLHASHRELHLSK